MDGYTPLDRLKDHYKHCIRLSASNKINTKNAFDLQLIDYMQDLVSGSEDGQMNFKIASSALDVGAKIYSNRVDCIQSEAQKVASSILMALDGQKGDCNLNDSNAADDASASLNQSNEGADGEDGVPAKAAKKKVKRNVKTIVEDDTNLDTKLEHMVLGDPFLDGLSEDFDMSCPAALICYNALTQPNCLQTIDSNNFRKNYRDTLDPTPEDNYNFVTLVTKNVNCAQIIRNNQTNQICPRLQSFLFNDRTTKISGLDTNLDDTINPANLHNTNRPMPDTSVHAFDPEQYDDCAANDNYSDAADDGFNEQNENDLIPNLDKIVACEPSDYVYTGAQPRLLNTWAGPTAWKVAKAPQTARKDTKSSRKRSKLEKLPIEWSEDIDAVDEDIADKTIRHSTDALRKWQDKRLFRPQDHNYDEESAITIVAHTFLKPEDTYHCMKTPADALKSVDNDHDYTNRQGSLDEAPNSPGFGGFDDVHDDSDDEFRADPVVDGNEVAIYGAQPNMTLSQQADLEFAGEHLIEQPYTVTQVVIPFARVAKKMNVRKLKHIMWGLLLPPANLTEKSITNHDITVIENGLSDCENVDGDQLAITETSKKKTPSPTPSESSVHLAFSNLYTELPVNVGTKMASDLSQPIAFVTLLHLANEKNLKLIPNQDLKDFVIEQDELTT